jgi:hypothetical protein
MPPAAAWRGRHDAVPSRSGERKEEEAVARRKNSAELYEILRRMAEQKEGGQGKKGPGRAFSLKGLFQGWRARERRPPDRPPLAGRPPRDPASPSRAVHAAGDGQAPAKRRVPAQESPQAEAPRAAPRGYRDYLAFTGGGESGAGAPPADTAAARRSRRQAPVERRGGAGGFLGFRSVLSPWRSRDAVVATGAGQSRSGAGEEAGDVGDAGSVEAAAASTFLTISGGKGSRRRVDPAPVAAAVAEPPRPAEVEGTATAPLPLPAAPPGASPPPAEAVELIAPVEEDGADEEYLPTGVDAGGVPGGRVERGGSAPVRQLASAGGDAEGRAGSRARVAPERSPEPPAAIPVEPATRAPNAGDARRGPMRPQVPRFAAPGPEPSRPGWGERLRRLPARLLEGVVGGDLFKLFRRPLEVRVGTLLVGFTAIGISVAIAVISVSRHGMREPPSAGVEALSRDALDRDAFPDAEGAVGEAAILDGAAGRPEAAGNLFPGLGRAYSLPGVHHPDPDPLPEVRNVSGAATSGPAPPPDPAATARLFAPANAAALAGRHFVQAHAFLTEEVFIHLAGHLRAVLGFDNVLRGPMRTSTPGGPFYILYLGPYEDSQRAEAAMDRLVRTYAARPLLRTQVPKSLATAYHWQIGEDQVRGMEVFVGQ